MLYEAGRSRWGGAVAATFGASLLVAGAACGGGLEDSGRFEQPPPVLGSVPIAGAGAGGAGDDQMLPVLPASEAVDPLPPVAPSTPDAGTAPLGAGGTGPVAPIVMPAPACVADLFASRCAGLECHGPGAPEVDLISPGVAERLVDRPSSPSLLCAGRTYVATDGSPSLLLDKLRDTPPCGSPMPLRGNIGAQHVDCLVQWVASLQQLSSDFDAGTI